MPSGFYMRTEEHKQRMKGRKISEETRKKLSESHKGLNIWSKGKKTSAETKLKISNSHIESKSYLWKGDGVGYRGLHTWIAKKLGKANHCEECGLDKIPEGKKRYFQWANVSHEYKRDIKDFKQLCLKCHKQYDAKIESL